MDLRQKSLAFAIRRCFTTDQTVWIRCASAVLIRATRSGDASSCLSCVSISCSHNNNSRGNVTRPAAPGLEGILWMESSSILYMSKWSLFPDVWICAFLLHTLSSIDYLASDFYILASHFVPLLICRLVPMVCIPYLRFSAWNKAFRTYHRGSLLTSPL